MNKILSVNYVIPANDDTLVSFASKGSLSDADIVLFNPPYDQSLYPVNKYWKDELTHVLSLGKTIFILLQSPNDKRYDFLPFASFVIVPTNGIDVYPTSKLVNPLHNSLKEYWSAQSYLTHVEEKDILFTTNTMTES